MNEGKGISVGKWKEGEDRTDPQERCPLLTEAGGKEGKSEGTTCGDWRTGLKRSRCGPLRLAGVGKKGSMADVKMSLQEMTAQMQGCG